MKISVVIPNYNGIDLLKENLPKLLKVIENHQNSTDDKIQIVIVDDSSTDDSFIFLQEFKKQFETDFEIEILKNNRNLGFSSSVNKGVESANGDILIFLNTDVVPEIGFIKPLLPYFSDDKTFAVGCMDRSIEENDEVLRGRGIGKWEKGFLVHKKGNIHKNTTLWVSGGSGAFRKTYFERLGGFNTLMNPFYWEDIDLSYRAQKAGFNLFFEKESIVTHIHSLGAIKMQNNSQKVRVISYRNQYIFAWTNMTDITLLISHILFQPYHLLRSLINMDSSFYKGLFKALILLPKILDVRRDIQKDVVLSDRSVIRRQNT